MLSGRAGIRMKGHAPHLVTSICLVCSVPQEATGIAPLHLTKSCDRYKEENKAPKILALANAHKIFQFNPEIHFTSLRYLYPPLVVVFKGSS